MQQLRLGSARTNIVEAWTLAEIQAGVAALLESFADRLPADKGARVVIKPNLNNDLVALTGNSVDLRVLGALLGALRDRGYHDLTVADGANVGIDRRRIDVFQRLRVDRLVARHDAALVNLNDDQGSPVVLHGGGRPRVAHTVLHADFLISLPKIKTHAEVGFSGALKNWIGIAVGQDKRQMHYDLPRNIFALNEVVAPDLVLVDGLVGMEGNGPGDGQPFRFGRLIASDDAFVNDLVLCRLVDLDWRAVPYLVHAHRAGRIDDALIAQVSQSVSVVRPILPAPARSHLNQLASSPRTLWFKKLIRPITDVDAVADLAHRTGVIQDVYEVDSDGVTGVVRDPAICGDCTRCVDFCPEGLSLEQIGAQACMNCLYCWLVCPKPGALTVQGPLGHLERQVARYKKDLESL